MSDCRKSYFSRHGIDARQHLHLVLTAAEARQPRHDIAVKFLCPFEMVLRGKDQLRHPRSKVAAGIRCTGLHHNRPPLRRARNIQRPAHREVFAAVVQHMHFVRVEEHPRCLVADERIVVPTVP
jgi:hypothetical protein